MVVCDVGSAVQRVCILSMSVVCIPDERTYTLYGVSGRITKRILCTLEYTEDPLLSVIAHAGLWHESKVGSVLAVVHDVGLGASILGVGT